MDIIQTAKNAINAVLGPDLIAKYEAKQHAARVSLHAKLAADRVAVQRAMATDVARLEPASVTAVADVAKTKAAYDAAVVRQRALWREIAVVKHLALSKIERLEVQLNDTAPAAIDDALARLDRQLDRRAINQHVRVTEHRPPGISVIMSTSSNLHAIAAIQIAGRAARHRLAALKLAPVDDVAAAIAAIEQSIPWGELQVMKIDGGASKRVVAGAA